MANFVARLRAMAAVLAFAIALAIAAVAAMPASAQVNPTADAVKEQQLLNALKEGGAIRGLVSIPDKKAANLIHPAGRDWREFRTVWLKWIGGIFIIGMLVVVSLFYMWRGSIRIEGGRSGRKIVRFSGFERFTHWLTATTFVVLGVTGLNITFGRALILPWMGADAFSAWSEWAKVAHNFLSFAFTIGVVLMFLMWIGQNFPTKADIEWFKTGGGMFSKVKTHAPAWKFNGGQKLLYWFVVLGGALMIVTGFILMFPFSNGLTVSGMELAQVFHGTVGVMFVALIIAHVYLGTLGMEGALESMTEGTVDINWAKEHHPLWLEEEMQHGANVAGTQPAE